MALKYFISLIFIIIYIFFGNEIGFSETSPAWTHFTFSFQHAGLIHLIINTLVFITASRTMEKFVSWKTLFPVIYMCAVIASFMAERSLPTVGASGMIYALFGMEVVIVLFNRSTVRQKALFFFAVFVMLLFSFLSTSSNFMIHVLSFCFGFIFYAVKRKRHFHKPLFPH
ncbi:MAG: rhomboid family intramembrane serine protease [Proteiniphilum sp.]|nr:rhomboid family intramembrane serine protease [Proteiniphilum sp.]